MIDTTLNRFEIKTDLEIQIEEEQKMLDLIGDLTSFYREHPHVFAKDYLNIHLYPFQEILLYEMFHNNYFNFNACRGIGKSWLIAVYAVIKCILYPGSKICVTSSKLKQAVEVLKKIENELRVNNDWGSELLNAEIERSTLNGSDPEIKFCNGSFIYAVAANKNARSKRSTENIYDEFVQMDRNIIQEVLQPFLHMREVGFTRKDKYRYWVEDTKEFYLSSAWYKSEWSFRLVQSYVTNMVYGLDYFTCCIPYQLCIEAGILSPRQIQHVYNSSDFDAIKFSMEYECIWFGSNGSEFYSFDNIAPCRIMKQAFPIPELALYGKTKVPEVRFKEKRILSVDVALISSKKNDNDAACLIINDVTLDGLLNYKANIKLIKVFEGLRTEELGLLAMQYYYAYGCTDICVDAKGNGIGVLDYITKEQTNSITGEIMKPFKAVNDKVWAERTRGNNYTESLWIMQGSEKLNDEASNWLQNAFINRKIELLVTEYDGYSYLCDIDKKFENKSDQEQLKYQESYIETTLLVNEMINLEYEIKNNKVRVYEKSGMRKDRYSSLAYNFWVMKQLEYKLKPDSHDDDDSLDDLVFRKPNYGFTAFG